jgi:nucleotide-binding universal stress UspA family protein
MQTEAQLRRFIRKAGTGSFHRVGVVVQGHAPFKLPEIARKRDIELIVVGKHGRWRIEEFLLGSVTLHVLSQSHCDVLVVD